VVSTRVDEVQRLARAFDMEAWELLRPQGHVELSPLARRLAAHLDRAAQDEATHSAAFAAAMAVIDALATRPDTPPELPRKIETAPLPSKEERNA